MFIYSQQLIPKILPFYIQLFPPHRIDKLQSAENGSQITQSQKKPECSVGMRTQ